MELRTVLLISLVQGCAILGPGDVAYFVSGKLENPAPCQLQLLVERTNNVLDSRQISNEFDVTLIHGALLTRPRPALTLLCDGKETTLACSDDMQPFAELELGTIHAAMGPKTCA